MSVSSGVYGYETKASEWRRGYSTAPSFSSCGNASCECSGLIASTGNARASRIQICNQVIMSPLLDAVTSDFLSACGDAYSVPTSRADSMADIDANLLRVIDSWPNLPAALKAAVLAIIDATKRDV